MSDYLRGVVTRVLAPSRLLQPRVLTPFESSAPMSVDVHVATPAAMAPSISPSRRTTAIPRRETRSISPAPDIETASVPADDASVDRAFGARPVASAHVPGVTQSETPPGIGGDPFEDPVARSIFATTNPIAAPAEPPIARPLHRAAVAPAESAIERAPADPTLASSAPGAAPHFSRRARVASIPPVTRLPVTRRRDRAHEESRATTAAGPIEITIGRIDVRAVVANTPAPAKPRAKALVMSLDDYLATRGGGE